MNQVGPKPLEQTILDKVGVRYLPRVLVVTSGTQVVFRNKKSPCRGFQVQGRPSIDNNVNLLISEGTEQTATAGRQFAKPACLIVKSPERT